MSKNVTVIESEVNKIENYVENYVCQILENENFDAMNHLQARKSENRNLKNSNCVEDFTFISKDIDSLTPYSSLITEKEFYKIVEANDKDCYRRSGIYQQCLFSNYKYAVEIKDNGYIEDVLKKAIIFNHNRTFVKALMQNKKFMKEWRRNFANYTPLAELKNTGSLKRINIILRTMQ